MTISRVCVVINPISGRASKKRIPDMIRTEMVPAGYDPVFRFTAYEGHAKEIVREELSGGTKMFIAVGGDGTINEVAQAIIETDCILGIIPMGSGNGLARDLNLPLNIKKAISVIKSGNVRVIDYGKANQNIFFCTCGMGFDAQISSDFAESSTRGPLTYVTKTVSRMFNFHPETYEVISDEFSYEDKAIVIACGNASQYGNNAYITPNANMEDGKLNISILKPMSFLEYPKLFLQLFTKQITKNKNTLHFLSKEVLIRREKEGYIHIDGEPKREKKDIKIRIYPSGLRVLAP